MKTKAYNSTSTPVAKSQEDIRWILRKYGADGVQFSEDWKAKKIMVRFLYSIGTVQYSVFFSVPIPDVDVRTGTGRQRKASQMELLKAQTHRGIWRAVFWAIKSRMEAVEFGIETFQEAFMSHFEIPGTSQTIGDVVLPRFEAGSLKALVDMRGKA
jgi:hypothetical protein